MNNYIKKIIKSIIDSFRYRSLIQTYGFSFPLITSIFVTAFVIQLMLGSPVFAEKSLFLSFCLLFYMVSWLCWCYNKIGIPFVSMIIDTFREVFGRKR